LRERGINLRDRQTYPNEKNRACREKKYAAMQDFCDLLRLLGVGLQQKVLTLQRNFRSDSPKLRLNSRQYQK
ncbi:MAG: hypothetical protein Q4D23_01920, partial [Bacteroidales bacterium]|nr:hypothetical protein [Bacteroidales bacterium]